MLRGNAAEPHDVTLVREKLPPTQVSGRVAAGGVGVLRIAAFGAGTPDAIARTVSDLEKQGATQLVVDVRSTSTGSVNDGVEAARLFVASGTLAQRELRGQAATPIAAKAGDGRISLPAAVLTTNGTSGAAEILAAALAGNGRATTVGERTLGRAAEQRLVRLSDGSGLWMTFARFLTPAGKPIHGHGVEPAVAVEEPDVEFGAEAPMTDPILEKAIEALAARKAA